MGRILANQTNIEAPSGDFPFGRIKNDTGSGDGVPVDEKVYGDLHQLVAKLVDETGIVLNDLPDNVSNGFQFFEALLALETTQSLQNASDILNNTLAILSNQAAIGVANGNIATNTFNITNILARLDEGDFNAF